MRRRAVGKRRSSNTRLDWVYRQSSRILGTGTGSDTLGSYDNINRTLTAGVGTAQTLVLYDSANFFADLGRGGVGSGLTVGTQDTISRAGRASGRKAVIRAVQGQIFIQPSVWAIGSQMGLGLRLGVYQQAMEGPAQLDLQESMFIDNAIFPREMISWYANSVRKNCWERRYYKAFGDASTTPNMTINVRWRGRKYLDDNEGFFLYMEAPSSGIMASVNLRYVTFLRTLVETHN